MTTTRWLYGDDEHASGIDMDRMIDRTVNKVVQELWWCSKLRRVSSINYNYSNCNTLRRQNLAKGWIKSRLKWLRVTGGCNWSWQGDREKEKRRFSHSQFESFSITAIDGNRKKLVCFDMVYFIIITALMHQLHISGWWLVYRCKW